MIDWSLYLLLLPFFAAHRPTLTIEKKTPTVDLQGKAGYASSSKQTVGSEYVNHIRNSIPNRSMSFITTNQLSEISSVKSSSESQSSSSVQVDSSQSKLSNGTVDTGSLQWDSNPFRKHSIKRSGALLSPKICQCNSWLDFSFRGKFY